VKALSVVPGLPGSLAVSEVEQPSTAEGEVLVEVEAVAERRPT